MIYEIFMDKKEYNHLIRDVVEKQTILEVLLDNNIAVCLWLGNKTAFPLVLDNDFTTILN